MYATSHAYDNQRPRRFRNQFVVAYPDLSGFFNQILILCVTVSGYYLITSLPAPLHIGVQEGLPFFDPSHQTLCVSAGFKWHISHFKIPSSNMSPAACHTTSFVFFDACGLLPISIFQPLKRREECWNVFLFHYHWLHLFDWLQREMFCKNIIFRRSSEREWPENAVQIKLLESYLSMQDYWKRLSQRFIDWMNLKSERNSAKIEMRHEWFIFLF